MTDPSERPDTTAPGEADPPGGGPATTPPAVGSGTEVRFHYTPGFPDLLTQAGCALLISTYQAGQLVAVGVAEGELAFSFRRFDQVMGVALAADQLAVGARGQVWFLPEHSDLAPAIEPAGRYDRCWLPATTVVTGGIQCHELAWGTGPTGDPELWVVNTLFSCLAGLAPGWSFVPRWRPPFISQLAAQDRCHLNGLAIRDGTPAYVTVMATTDTPAGWREVRNDSGAVLDVASGEPVSTGLSMPHSLRWHQGHLYVLNSGLGRLEVVDPATGHREPVTAVPGYARGLALHHDLAFVGLSRIRETAIFGGAPIAAHHEQLKCGVGVIQLSNGTTLATLQFATGVEEIFDVQVLPTTRCPTLGGGDPDEIWLLPSRPHPRQPE